MLRLLGLWFLGAALILLVIDGTRSLAASALVITELAGTIDHLMPDVLETVQGFVSTNVHPLLWDPAMTTLLSWPGWLVLGALGALLLFVGRKRSDGSFSRESGY